MSDARDVTVTVKYPKYENFGEFITESVTISKIKARGSKKATIVLEDLSEKEIENLADLMQTSK